MSLSDHRGYVYAMREFHALAAKDCESGGEIKPARIVAKKANPAKTAIGWMRRRLLRGEFRQRA